MKKRRPAFRTRSLPKIPLRPLVVIGVLAIVVGLSVWLKPEPAPKTAGPTPVITHSSTAPDESAPDKNTFAWPGNAKDPKYISLPTIQAEGFMQNVGADQDDQIAAPTNIHMAGWYVASVSPGANGLSIIDGYADGKTTSGIFKNLSLLKEGDIFSIAFGNGTVRDFSVTKITTIATPEASKALFTQDPTTTNQLNLIAYPGVPAGQQNESGKRVIVSARLAE